MKRRIKTVMAWVLVIAVTSIFFKGNVSAREEATDASYRSVKVLELAAEAYVERDGKEIPAYVGMALQAGDILCTEEGNQAQLQMDDDKYLIVEENSRISFELKGNKKKGAIRIYLEKGAVFSDIRSALEKEDSYEIHTPDGVMAVRGTRFWVATGLDEDGNASYTRVVVTKGRVEVTTLGVNAKTLLLLEGEEAVIEGQAGEDVPANSKFLKGNEAIDLEDLPEYLQEMVIKLLTEQQAYFDFQRLLKEAQEYEAELAEKERQAALGSQEQPVQLPVSDEKKDSGNKSQSPSLSGTPAPLDPEASPTDNP